MILILSRHLEVLDVLQGRGQATLPVVAPNLKEPGKVFLVIVRSL